MIHNLLVWVEAHLAASLSLGAAFTAAATWVGSKLPGLVEKKVSIELGRVFNKVQNPKAKAFLLTLDKAVAEAVPEAGDARYAVLTDLLIKECPEAAPARELILALLTGLGAGAKAGLQDAAKPAN